MEQTILFVFSLQSLKLQPPFKHSWQDNIMFVFSKSEKVAYSKIKTFVKYIACHYNVKKKIRSMQKKYFYFFLRTFLYWFMSLSKDSNMSNKGHGLNNLKIWMSLHCMSDILTVYWNLQLQSKAIIITYFKKLHEQFSHKWFVLVVKQIFLASKL